MNGQHSFVLYLKINVAQYILLFAESLLDFFSGKDSFIAFEEILWYAKDHQVDFVLLGGDLFHDTNPSKEALHRYV